MKTTWQKKPVALILPCDALFWENAAVAGEEAEEAESGDDDTGGGRGIAVTPGGDDEAGGGDCRRRRPLRRMRPRRPPPRRFRNRRDRSGRPRAQWRRSPNVVAKTAVMTSLSFSLAAAREGGGGGYLPPPTCECEFGYQLSFKLTRKKSELRDCSTILIHLCFYSVHYAI